MNGNIAQEGIKLDLEWMHRVGIAGFQNFDAALQTPQVVDKRLAYMTPEWKEAFKYAIHVGDQFGMEMAIAGSPGWSESGGPWVPPSQGMKKYVWSETVVQGGTAFTGKLPHPPSTTGMFQNVGVREEFGPPPATPPPEFYADAAVIAFRLPADQSAENAAQPTIISSGEGFDPAMLSDGDLEKTTHIPIPSQGSESWIQFEYPAPHTVRSLTYVTKDPNFIEQLISHIGVPEKTLQASDDRQNFHQVVSLGGGRAAEHTISFARCEWPDCDEERYGVSGVSTRSVQPPHVPSGLASNSHAGAKRRGSGRTEADGRSQSRRRSSGVRETCLGTFWRWLRCAQSGHGDCLRWRESDRSLRHATPGAELRLCEEQQRI